MRSLLFYLLILPALGMVALALLRFRFAVQFWRKMYIVGLVYVALVLARLVFQLIG